MGLSSKAVVFASSSQFVDTANSLLVDVEDRDQRKREGVEVGVGILVACILSENETLEIAATFVFLVETTVGPGLNDDLVVVRDVQVGDSLLEFRVGFANIDKHLELFTVIGVSIEVQHRKLDNLQS